jgi:hypothetical protein
MAIVMMCAATDPGAVRDDYWSKNGHEIWTRETHKGLVLETREINGYDDSDFYAVVWNWEKGDTENVTYASTRGWTYPNGAAVDATEEVVAAYKALLAKREAERKAAALAREAATPRRGKRVRVITKLRGKATKHVEVGAEGTVFWTGEDAYKKRPVFGWADPREAIRVGVKLDNGGEHVFLAGMMVEVIEEVA